MPSAEFEPKNTAIRRLQTYTLKEWPPVSATLPFIQLHFH